ncbi:LPS assembly lipoprotein LptE [Sphingomonas cavernae]|uniref:LPS assembly lipoprotein LptE n=1 Tax=Sphingomonas cavernae TaxID=2320861 RepID=UPI001EE5B158|nr:LPS assembly lipoprotein LptE [Sphingomonas cavernae]
MRARASHRTTTLLTVVTASLALSGCGLRPLYGGGSKGAVAQSLGQIEVAAIPGKAGWLVRNAVTDRLGAMPQGAATYRLEIELDDQITGFGVRRDDTVTRERRTLRARYRLVEAGKGTVVLDATAGSDAGIDIVSSEYATIAAENTALENLSQVIADQIVTRLALYAQNSGDSPPAGTP